MSTSLPSLVDNLSEIYKKRMQRMHGKKKLGQNAILLGLKIINVKNAEKDGLSQ